MASRETVNAMRAMAAELEDRATFLREEGNTRRDEHRPWAARELWARHHEALECSFRLSQRADELEKDNA